MDKYRSWSDCDGIVESSFTKDELLATVTIFWVTETIVSSMRLYYDYASMKPRFGYDGLRVQAPTACAMFPAEMYHPLGAGLRSVTTSSGGPRCRRVVTFQRWRNRLS